MQTNENKLVDEIVANASAAEENVIATVVNVPDPTGVQRMKCKM